MSLPRRLINLAGALLVAAILVAGGFLVVFPLMMQSFDVSAQKLVIENSNSQLRDRITELQQQKAKLSEIDKQVADLRSQITQTEKFDDISRLVVNSASAAGVTVVKVAYANPTVFVANTIQATTPLGIPTAPVSVVPASSPPAEAATDQSNSSPAPDASQPATGQAQSANPGADPNGNIQVGVTIEVRTDSMDRLSGFLDQLRKGPRLLQIVKATATTASDEQRTISLSVDALTFLKTDTPESQR